METARDLACADLWQASLERSLARRGKADPQLTRAVPPSARARPQLRRRPPRVGDVLAASPIGRGKAAVDGAAGRRRDLGARAARGDHAARAAGRPRRLRADGADHLPSRRARAPRHRRRRSPRPRRPWRARPLPERPLPTHRRERDDRGGDATEPHRRHAGDHASRPAPARSAHATVATAHAAASTAHIAAAGDGTGGAASGAASVSGGAAPAGQHSVAAAPTHAAPAVHRRRRFIRPHSRPPDLVDGPPRIADGSARSDARPAAPAKTTTHASTGGGTIEEATSVGHRAPGQADHDRTHAKPVAKPHPVATTPPPAAKPAPAPAVAPGQYVNPLAGASVTPERIDQGVDYAGSGPLGAIGDGKITYVGTSGTGWPGAFVEYQLTDGPDAGRYVYYAEGISPAAGLHVGQTVHARAADRRRSSPATRTGSRSAGARASAPSRTPCSRASGRAATTPTASPAPPARTSQP